MDWSLAGLLQRKVQKWRRKTRRQTNLMSVQLLEHKNQLDVLAMHQVVQNLVAHRRHLLLRVESSIICVSLIGSHFLIEVTGIQRLTINVL